MNCPHCGKPVVLALLPADSNQQMLYEAFSKSIVSREPGEQPARLQLAVTEVESRFLNDIAHIRCSLGQDHTGEESIFFQVLLKDEAITGISILEVTRPIENALRQKISEIYPSDPRMKDLNVYCSWRTVSEQAKLKDLQWE